MGPNHLSRILLGEQGVSSDENLPNSYLFQVIMVDEQLEDINYFLTIRKASKKFTMPQRKHLVVKVVDYQLIASQLYKLGVDEILRRCILKH